MGRVPKRPIVFGFLDRFVHPRLAALSLFGIGIWAVSFLVAATGVGLRAVGSYDPAAHLFFYSGLIGLLGICLLAVATLWLAGLYVLQFARRE